MNLPLKLGLLSCALLLSWGSLSSFATPLPREQQYLALVGAQPSASSQFLQDLSEIWRMPGVSDGSTLQPVTVPTGKERLERMRNRRGHLAILSGEDAHLLLPKAPQLRVVTVLWPNVLHLIGRSQKVAALPAASSQTLRAPLGAFEVVRAWDAQSPRPMLQETTWFQPNQTLTALEDFREDVFLFWGGYPLRELRKLLQFPEFQLLSAEPNLQRAWREQLPWTRTLTLPPNTYPQTPELELLAAFPVLVAHETVPDALVRSLIREIFDHAQSSNPRAMFRNMSPQHNALFRRDLPYHPAARRAFRF